MKVEYDKVFVPNGKSSKKVSAENIKWGKYTTQELVEKIENVEKKHNELLALLKDKVIVSREDELIVAIDNQLHKGKITHVQQYKGENLKLYKIEDGKIVVDKKKVGAL